MYNKKLNLSIKLPLPGICLRIFLFIALVTGTALSLRPLHQMLLNRMENTRDHIIRLTEDFIGRRILYGSMGPSIFGVLDIRDIVFLRDDDSAVLSISRLRLSYSFLELLRGNFPGVFHTVRIDRPVLNLDLERDRDLVEKFSMERFSVGNLSIDSFNSNGQEGAPSFFSFLPDNFTLRILNGEWDFKGSAGNILISGFRFEASLRNERINFQSSWEASAEANLGTAGLQEMLPPFTASMSGNLNGVYYENINEGSIFLNIPHLSGDFFMFRPLTLGFFYADNKIEIRKTQDTSPYAITMFYDLITGDLSLRFLGEYFYPPDLLVFTGSWAYLNPMLDIRIYGSAELDFTGSDLYYYADFFGTGIPSGFTEAVSLELRANGDREDLTVDSLFINSPYGDLFFSGGVRFTDPLIAPYGTLNFSSIHLHDSSYSAGGLYGNLDISTRENEILLSGFAGGGEVYINDLNFSLAPGDNSLGFNFFANKISDDENINDTFISVYGIMDYGSNGDNGNDIQIHITVDSLYLHDLVSFMEPLSEIFIYSSFTLLTESQDVFLSTEIFIDSDFYQIMYNIPSFYAAIGNIASVDASFFGTNNYLALTEGRVSWNLAAAEPGFIDISSSIDIRDINDISFSLSAYYNELTYHLNGVILDQRQMSILGSYDFQAIFSITEDSTLYGNIQGLSIPVPLGGQTASLGFNISFFFASLNYWEAELYNFEASRLSTPASNQAYLNFSGRADERGITLNNIFFNDGLGELTGNLNLSRDFVYSGYSLGFYMQGVNRNEYYNVTGTYFDPGTGYNVLELFFMGDGMQLGRFSAYNAVLSSNVRLYWESISDFNADISISSFVLNQGGDLIQAALEAELNSNYLNLSGLTVNFTGLEASIPHLVLDRRNGLINSDINLSGSFSGIPVNLKAQGAAQFNSTGTWLSILDNFMHMDGALNVSDANYGNMIAEEPFSFDFSLRNEDTGLAMAVNGGPRNLLRFRYTPEEEGGSYSLALSAPSPVRGSVSGTLINGNIDAQGSDLYVDMSTLWEFIPSDDFPVQFPEGIVTGSIRVGGTLEDPEFYGSMRGTGVHVLVPDFIPEPIRPVPVVFTFNGTEFGFGPIDAVVGNGAGRAQGWFRFEQWFPGTLQVDILVPPQNPIPSAFNISGIMAEGLVSGFLSIGVEELLVSITGDLTAHNTDIRLSFEENIYRTIDPGPDDYNVVTNITIRAGRRVDFFWPSLDFPVLQANADMGTGIHIMNDSFSGRYSLTGDINLRSGELFYLERNFYVREGTLFFRENETGFNPRISARAEIRDQTEEGPVIISLIIDNSPLMSFTPRFESQPPLSQIEIYSILGHVAPDSSEGLQRNLATGAILDGLAQFYLVSRIQREIRNFLGLDMLSIRTQLFQNFVWQATGTQTSDPALINSPYRIGNYFDNTTVFLGRYFGPGLFGEALLSFRYDESRTGFGGIRFEPEIGIEMRNPLFDIRFSLIPLHPESWFIEDISFSLIWRRTF